MTPAVIIGIIVVILLVGREVRARAAMARVRYGARQWNVVGSYDNAPDAAKLLADTNAKIIDFFRFLRRKYHVDEPDDQIAHEGQVHIDMINNPNRAMIYALLHNYNPDEFYENDPRTSSDTSYTLGKGNYMYVCLRQRGQPEFLEDPNMLLFVMLHESSHIANIKSWGHDNYFWTTFKFILHEAQLAGIYEPRDYNAHPATYCGLHVQYNPLYDTSLPDLWK